MLLSVLVFAEGRFLVIEPKGRLAKFASLKQRLRIPISSIVQVSTDKVPKIKGIRLGGTALPPHYAGHFYSIDDGKIFYVLSNRDKCITIKTKDFQYSEIVVQVDDKERTAELIRKSCAAQ